MVCKFYKITVLVDGVGIGNVMLKSAKYSVSASLGEFPEFPCVLQLDQAGKCTWSMFERETLQNASLHHEEAARMATANLVNAGV